MNPAIYMQQAMHAIIEWLVSFGVAYWVAQVWQEQPVPLLVGLARHRQRMWIAIAFSLAPLILSLVLRGPLMALYHHENLTYARLPVAFALATIYGALLGIGATCAVAPARVESPFQPGAAGVLCAVFIVISNGLYMLLWRQPNWYLWYFWADLFLKLGILVVARKWAGEAVPPPLETPALPVRRNLALAIVLGFVPSALTLGAITVATNKHATAADYIPLLWCISIASAACCFFTSRTLFSRNTAAAIVGGVLLLLLNGFIAFFFGCCASVLR